MSSALALLRRAAELTYEENCLSISKGAAYSALLSFFPVLTTLATILVQARAPAVSQIFSKFLAEVVPPGAQELVLNRFAVEGERPLSLLIGAVLLSLYAASGVMLSLMEGFRAVYHIPVTRPWWKERLVAAMLVFASALPAIGASVLIILGNRTERYVIEAIGGFLPGQAIAGGLLLAGEIVRFFIALSAVVLVTMLLYKIGPNRSQPWSRIWRGAVTAAALWFLLTLGFSWYVRNLANYNVMYGSVATVAALIVWMYLLSVIVLYGCAYNAAWEEARHSRPATAA